MNHCYEIQVKSRKNVHSRKLNRGIKIKINFFDSVCRSIYIYIYIIIVSRAKFDLDRLDFGHFKTSEKETRH